MCIGIVFFYIKGTEEVEQKKQILQDMPVIIKCLRTPCCTEN